MTQEKVWIVCTACGSHVIRCDAYAAWNADTQEWEISSLFDNTDCEDCGGECSTIECSTAQGIDPEGYTIEEDVTAECVTAGQAGKWTWETASKRSQPLDTRADALQAAIDHAAKVTA